MEPKSADEALAMIQSGMQSLIQHAPSPELGQQLEQILQAVVSLVQGGQQAAPENQPASPEQGGNPNAKPMEPGA